MNKKGFIGDYILYGIMLFILSLALLSIYLAISNVNTAWQNTPNLGTESKEIMSDFTDRWVNIWDTWYLLLVIGYVIVTIILAFALRSHPVFLMLSLLFMIIMGILGVHFANAYHDIASSDTFSSYALDMTFMTFLMQKLPFILVIFGVLFLIILYAKSRNQGVSL